MSDTTLSKVKADLNQDLKRFCKTYQIAFPFQLFFQSSKNRNIGMHFACTLSSNPRSSSGHIKVGELREMLVNAGRMVWQLPGAGDAPSGLIPRLSTDGLFSLASQLRESFEHSYASGQKLWQSENPRELAAVMTATDNVWQLHHLLYSFLQADEDVVWLLCEAMNRQELASLFKKAKPKDLMNVFSCIDLIYKANRSTARDLVDDIKEELGALLEQDENTHVVVAGLGGKLILGGDTESLRVLTFSWAPLLGTGLPWVEYEELPS